MLPLIIIIILFSVHRWKSDLSRQPSCIGYEIETAVSLVRIGGCIPTTSNDRFQVSMIKIGTDRLTYFPRHRWSALGDSQRKTPRPPRECRREHTRAVSCMESSAPAWARGAGAAARCGSSWGAAAARGGGGGARARGASPRGWATASSRAPTPARPEIPRLSFSAVACISVDHSEEKDLKQ